MSSKLQQYLSKPRVSQEDFDENGEQLDPALVEQNEIVEEQELEVPAVEPEVTEDQIYDATEEAEEAEEAVAEMPEEIEEVADVETDVTEELASIEEFAGVLRHGIRTKTYSPQFAAAVQGRLNRLNDMFDVSDDKRVSLENYGGEDLAKYYQVSLETFSGFAKRLSDLLNNAVKGLADKLNNKWSHDNFVKKAQALNLRADAVVSAQGKAEPFVAKGKSVAKDFQIGGQFGGDPLASITSDMRFLSSNGAKLIKNIDTYLNKTMDIIESAVKDGGVGKTGDIVAKVLDLTRPVDELPENAFTGAMSGGLVFVKSENKAKEGDRRAAYKDIARGAIPGISGVSFKGDAQDVTIDKATADKLAKAAKNLVAMGMKIVEANGLKSVQTFYRRVETQQRAVKSANATSWGENKDLNTLASNLVNMGFQQFNVYYTLLHTVFDTANEAIALAEKAVEKGGKKEAPAAAE